MAGWAFFITLWVSTLVCSSASGGTLSIRLSDGTTLVAEVRLPRGTASGAHRSGRRLPAFLVFGGFESAAQVLALVPEDFPAAVASFDYPFAGARKFRFPQTLVDAPALKRMVRQTQEGIPLLARRVAELPEVDPARIGLLGGSFATPFVVDAAAREARISMLIVLHGFGEVRVTLKARLVQEFGKTLPGWMARPLASVCAGGIQAYFKLPEPVEAARALRPSQSVLLIDASGDHWIPATSQRALWEAVARSPAQSTRWVMEGDHLMPGQTARIRGILERVRPWLRQNGFLNE